MKPVTDIAIRGKNRAKIRDQYLLPIVVPALAGSILSVLLAFLIVQRLWFAALVLVVGLPVAILLNTYPLIAVILWLFLMPFLPTNNVAPYILWVVHRALIPFALGIAILSRILRLKKYPPIQLGRAELAMLSYLVLAATSILLTQRAPLKYLYELYDKTFVPFAAYWLIRLSNLREQDLKRWIPGMLITCIAEIAIGFWAKYAPYSLPPLWTFERMGERMSGTYNGPTAYAYTLVLCMVFLFHYAMNCAKGLRRILLVLTFGMGLVCIFLSYTRACWLAGVVTLLGLLVIYPKPALSLILITVPVMIISSISVLATEFSFAFKRLNTEETVDSRIVLLHAGQQMFLAKPLLGWGYASYDLHDWQFMERVGNAAPSKWDVQKGTSHNTFITILAEMGVIGFFFYTFPFVWWLYLTIKVLPRLPNQGFWSQRLLIVMWLSVAAYLIVGLAVDMRFFWFTLGAWWLTLGAIAHIVQTYLLPGDTGLSEQLKRTVSDRAITRRRL